MTPRLAQWKPRRLPVALLSGIFAFSAPQAFTLSEDTSATSTRSASVPIPVRSPEENSSRIATPPANSTPASQNPATEAHKGWQPLGSFRLRTEFWDWFDAGTDKQNAYTFTSYLLRFGVSRTTSREDITLELAQPSFFNIPRNGIAPAPQGQLGVGPIYFAANGNRNASLFHKQAFVRFKNLGGDTASSLRAGRFEFNDGAETVSPDPDLQWVKKERIAQRLISACYGASPGRSVDGLQYVHNTPKQNLTAAAFFPSRGVFDLNGADTMTDLRLLYFSATWPEYASKKATREARLFAIYYEDIRDQINKNDNRPLAIRSADRSPIRITTLGGDVLRGWQLSHGKLDAFFWGALQFGDWGSQSHGAYAYVTEIGYQPNHLTWNPWFRLGFTCASGDGDTSNNQHGTFFPLLLGPRHFARHPFYTEANINDLYLDTVLRPNSHTLIRADLHHLWLPQKNDLWYVVGGPFQDFPSFGLGGRPSNGSRDLGTLFDVSVDYQMTKALTLSAYFGYVWGGSVIQGVYPDANSAIGYLETQYRW